MLRKSLKLLILAGFCLIGLGMVAPLSSHTQDKHRTDNRMYVDPNQVSIDGCGIFLNTNDTLKSVEAVYHDTCGFYVKQVPSIHGSCQNGHKSVSYLKECAEPMCPYYYAESDW